MSSKKKYRVKKITAGGLLLFRVQIRRKFLLIPYWDEIFCDGTVAWFNKAQAERHMDLLLKSDIK
jgi:hypothetical protein